MHKTFRDVVSQYLPVPAPDEGVYIVNIFLTICTCVCFVHKGQPYFVSVCTQCSQLQTMPWPFEIVGIVFHYCIKIHPGLFAPFPHNL